jgi:hypothetical protein
MVQSMTVLQDLQLPSDVEVLCLTTQGPLWLHGHARMMEEDCIELMLTSELKGCILGSKVILTIPDSPGPMMSLLVEETHGEQLLLRPAQVHHRDKRLFPRHFGHIPLRYRLIEPEEGELIIHRWIRDGGAPAEGWEQPEPYMNFSVSGVSFERLVAPDMDQKVLVDLGVGDIDHRWKVLAQVVRVLELPDDKYEVALSFENISEDAREALSTLTLSIQEALL